MNLNKKIIYGTMRMLSVKRSLSKWIYIFDELTEKGIDSFHVSKEYKSYKIFLEVFKKSKINKVNTNIYTKCYSPNFDEKIYDEKKLNSLIDCYLKDLNIDKINMQWMWRGNLNNERLRCKTFMQSFDILDSSFLNLKKKKVNEIYCFPYTIEFAKLVHKIENIEGLSIYFNPNETSYKNFLGKKNLGIRPLCSGKIPYKYDFEDLINFSLNEKKITKVMISINKIKNFKKLYNYLNV